MARFKNLFRLSLLFAVVILISSKASARNEPGVSQTQGGKQVDDWHGGGGGWHGGGGGGGWHGGGGHGGGGGGGWHGGGGGGWHGGGGGGGWNGGGGGGGWHGGCQYSHCKEGAGGDETHQTHTETNSGDKHMP